MALAQHLTHSFKPDEVQQKWYLVDATDQTLGRVASRVAHLLRGKHKPTFTTNTDCGDFVVIVNAEKVKIAPKREELKTYFHHTLYPNGATVESLKHIMRTKPERVLEFAVKGMIPKTKLGQRISKKLKIYAGPNHPHKAQKPEPIKF